VWVGTELTAASDFIERWYKQLFVRCLPWPTTLRVIDAVVSEGESDQRATKKAGLTSQDPASSSSPP